MDNRIFALDIGTRKILGLVMQKNGSLYEIVASDMLEHSTRAMMDGQIHDVEAVSATIIEIKNKLEEKLQAKLQAAAVAAAGRALKTSVASTIKRRSVLDEIGPDEVRALEIEAVHRAQYQLGQEEVNSSDRSQYFCVGYSVMSYQLEEQEIANLVGQVGSSVGVKVIATFLPRVVVDSLFSSLKRAGLDIYSLTLEPIAALSLAIPPSMRLLNLALVDIGAGTSDIAIVKNGNIFAYAMVPMGGDKLTEYLASRYLLDFNYAEKIKRSLSGQAEVEIKDILGNKNQMNSAEILDDMQPVINELVTNISTNILELNQKAPDAVICVGGGSLTPSLIGNLADSLNLPKNRVGIKTPETFEQVVFDIDYLRGPQGVTPLGIAYNSFARLPVPFIKAIVNEREIALWNMGKLDVGTALLSSGINLANIYGKPGMGKTIKVNGELRIFKGEMGTSPSICINGETASLETLIKEGDRIEFTPGQNGLEATIMVADLVPSSEGQVFVNGDPVQLKPLVMVNGKQTDFYEEIPDRAQVEFKAVNSLPNILTLAGVSEHWQQEKTYRFYINEQEIMFKWTPLKVLVNGLSPNQSQEVEFGSQISYTLSQSRPRLKDVLQDIDDLRLEVSVNGQKTYLEGKGAIVKMDGRVVGMGEELDDGARIELDKTGSNAMLSDIFQVIQMETEVSGRLKIKVDGADAGFTTPIYNHSEIELWWED